MYMTTVTSVLLDEVNKMCLKGESNVSALLINFC